MKRYYAAVALVLVLAGGMVHCSSGGGGGGNTSNNNSATIDVPQAPTIVDKSTDGSSCGVNTGAAISVTFSEDMIASSITNTTFTIEGVSGAVTYNASTRTATFTPSSALVSSASYSATVTTGVKNSAGTATANNYTWSFTTADAPPASTHLMGGAIQGNPLNVNANLVSVFTGSAGGAGSSDGAGTAAMFNNPSGITTDGTNLYVADTDNNTIRKIVISTGAVTTLAGSAGSTGSTDGIGTAARFYGPSGITTDGTNLYVADTDNNTIRKIVISTGAVTTLAGSAGIAGGTDGIGTAASFNVPRGITTDGTNLYVADMWNHAIRKIVISTGAVTTVAAGFNDPCGITTDGTNLYVADTYNHTIRKIVISSVAVSTLAGSTGSSGSTDGTGTAAQFYRPKGITTDGTNLYVADTENLIVRKILIATGAVTTLTAKILSFPEGITTDGVNLYTPELSDIIHKISPLTTAPSAPTGVIATAGNGQATISWNNITGADCYNLYCSEGTLVTTTTGTKISSIASPYVYSGLTNGITLACIVTSENDNGEGPPSPVVTVIPSDYFTLSVSVSSSNNGGGTVTSSPTGINCGSTCTAKVTNGATVTLTATPASGSTFSGWSGTCSGTGACTVLMDTNRTATAAFTGSGSGGGGGNCSYYYNQFMCGQGGYAGGLVPAGCNCPTGTTYAGTDNVTSGGPWNICTCN